MAQAHTGATLLACLHTALHDLWPRACTVPAQGSQASSASLVTAEDTRELASGADSSIAGQRLLGRGFLRAVLARCAQAQADSDAPVGTDALAVPGTAGWSPGS